MKKQLICTVILGKFGQRLNKSQLEFVREEHHFWRLLADQKLEIRDIIFHGEQCAQIEYSEREPFLLPGTNTNVVIAAFTTACARLHLYESLERLGPRVLYYDTGCCCCWQKRLYAALINYTW